ncbi:MAG: hypothetical protein HWN67_23305, partial [Candidatus Helarchaeota archaeon]|nr:hypothetical protein [Candidatus Helarchaeota archaeon]
EESPLGTKNLEKQFDNLYQINFLVPLEPKYYPLVEGVVNIYEGIIVVGQVPISIHTIYELNVSKNIINNNNESIYFHVNLSYASFSGPRPTYNSNVYAEIFKNDLYLEIKNFSSQSFTEHSEFSLNYTFIDDGVYYFNISYEDPYHPEGYFLFESTYPINRSSTIDKPTDDDDKGDNGDDSGDDKDDDEDDTDNSDILFYLEMIGVIAFVAFIALVTIIGSVVIVRSHKPGEKLNEKNQKSNAKTFNSSDSVPIESFFDDLDDLIESDDLHNRDPKY